MVLVIFMLSECSDVSAPVLSAVDPRRHYNSHHVNEYLAMIENGKAPLTISLLLFSMALDPNHAMASQE